MEEEGVVAVKIVHHGLGQLLAYWHLIVLESVLSEVWRIVLDPVQSLDVAVLFIKRFFRPSVTIVVEFFWISVVVNREKMGCPREVHVYN